MSAQRLLYKDQTSRTYGIYTGPGVYDTIMTTDPLSPLSTAFIRHVQDKLREDRKDMLSRIRDHAHKGADEETIQILIDGTTIQIMKRIETAALLYVDQIYIRSLNRIIGDISQVIPGIPAYITKEDREKIISEVSYLMSLVQGSLSDRNESIRKIILFDKQGISGRINEANNEITRRWMPKVEKAIRIGMMHAWNAAAWSRIKEYSSGKRWVSGPSSEVPDHPEMDGIIIPVNSLFKVPDFHPGGDKRRKPVPGCEMLYPGDVSQAPDPHHLAGCWCRIEAAELPEKPVSEELQPAE
jgi:hypothetical protein